MLGLPALQNFTKKRTNNTENQILSLMHKISSKLHFEAPNRQFCKFPKNKISFRPFLGKNRRIFGK